MDSGQSSRSRRRRDGGPLRDRRRPPKPRFAGASRRPGPIRVPYSGALPRHGLPEASASDARRPAGALTRSGHPARDPAPPAGGREGASRVRIIRWGPPRASRTAAAGPGALKRANHRRSGLRGVASSGRPAVDATPGARCRRAGGSMGRSGGAAGPQCWSTIRWARRSPSSGWSCSAARRSWGIPRQLISAAEERAIDLFHVEQGVRPSGRAAAGAVSHETEQRRYGLRTYRHPSARRTVRRRPCAPIIPKAECICGQPSPTWKRGLDEVADAVVSRETLVRSLTPEVGALGWARD